MSMNRNQWRSVAVSHTKGQMKRRINGGYSARCFLPSDEKRVGFFKNVAGIWNCGLSVRRTARD
jgi:hypothetical protein